MKTEQEWQSIFERWQVSTMPQHEFCKTEGIRAIVKIIALYYDDVLH